MHADCRYHLFPWIEFREDGEEPRAGTVATSDCDFISLVLALHAQVMSGIIDAATVTHGIFLCCVCVHAIKAWLAVRMPFRLVSLS